MVDHVCSEVAVMFAGRIVEQGPPEVLFSAAAHPYTRALMAAMPQARGPAMRGPRHENAGKPPGEARIKSARVTADAQAQTDTAPSGCSFAARCPYRQPRCTVETPPLRRLGNGHVHLAACHFAESVMNEQPVARRQGGR